MLHLHRLVCRGWRARSSFVSMPASALLCFVRGGSISLCPFQALLSLCSHPHTSLPSVPLSHSLFHYRIHDDAPVSVCTSMYYHDHREQRSKSSRKRALSPFSSASTFDGSPVTPAAATSRELVLDEELLFTQGSKPLRRLFRGDGVERKRVTTVAKSGSRRRWKGGREGETLEDSGGDGGGGDGGKTGSNKKKNKPLYDLTVNSSVQLLMNMGDASKSKSRQRFEELWLSEKQRVHRDKEADRVRRKSNFVLSLPRKIPAMGAALEGVDEEEDGRGKGQPQGSPSRSSPPSRQRHGIFRGTTSKSELKKEHVSRSFLATYWRGGVSVNLRDIQRLKERLNELEFKVSERER